MKTSRVRKVSADSFQGLRLVAWSVHRIYLYQLLREMQFIPNPKP